MVMRSHDRKGNGAWRLVKKMKKILMLSLPAFLILAGCSGTAEQSQEPETDSAESAAVPIEPEQMETELEAIDVSRMPSAGEYYGNSAWSSHNSSGMFAQGYEPSIALFKDCTFVFTENLLSGMGTYTGTYDMDSSQGITCTVKSVSFSGYKGADVKEIVFTRPNPYNLQLETDLCGSTAGEQFYWVPGMAGAGSYISTDNAVEDKLKPAIAFNSDQTFSMKENFLAGMGTYTGVYVFDSNQWICKVESTNFAGVMGDDVKMIKFGNYSKDEIMLGTDLCMSLSGRIFKKTDSVDTYTVGGGKDGSGKTSGEGAAGPPESYKTGTVFIVAGADSNRIKVRNGPGLSAADTGDRMYSGNKVVVYEETVKDGYTWYRIGTDRWMAGNGTSFGIKYD